LGQVFVYAFSKQERNITLFFLTFPEFFGTFFPLYPFIIAMIPGTCKKPILRQTDLTISEAEQTNLIQRACSDPDAFAQLYLLHYNNIFNYCLRRLFDRHHAEDVTSTVFFKAMHSLSSFRGKAAYFRSWLLRIATNAVNDHLRDTKRRADIMQKVVKNTRAESACAIGTEDGLIEKKTHLKKALLSLKPKYQDVIALRFFEKMKLTEIAACLGKNPSTIRTWLNRATAKLRKKLNVSVNTGGAVI
jgi:RNA polymerase sigma-70 factor (ECF subfamily)